MKALTDLKIIWAVDAIDLNGKLQAKALAMMKSVLEDLTAKIEPVYVMMPDELRFSRGHIPVPPGEAADYARELVGKWLKSKEMTNIEAPTVLSTEHNSTKDAVMTLIQYAKARAANLICLSTHARTGIERILLGSFCETLAQHSPVPLLVFNSKSVKWVKPKNVFFPTDFSTTSKSSLQSLMPFAKAFDAKVILFHQLEVPEFYAMTPLGGIPVSPDIMDEQINNLKSMGTKWVAELAAEGLAAEFVLNMKPTAIDDAILTESAKLQASIIAMGAESGPIKAALLGSHARDIMRQSTVPVLISHVK